MDFAMSRGLGHCHWPRWVLSLRDRKEAGLGLGGQSSEPYGVGKQCPKEK